MPKISSRKRQAKHVMDRLELDRRVEKVREALENRKPLAKDLLLDSGKWGLDGNKHRLRDLKVERCVLQALVGPTASLEHHRQAVKAFRCRAGARCGMWFCWLCRHLSWRRQRRLLRAMVKGVPSSNIMAVTVLGRVVPDDPEAIRTSTKDLQNRWLTMIENMIPTATWHGRIEFDPLSMPHLGPELGRYSAIGDYKFGTLRELGIEDIDETDVVVPHLHAFVIHPDDTEIAVRRALRSAYPAFRQVVSKTLFPNLSRKQNLDNYSRYARSPLPDKEWMFGRGSKWFRPRQPLRIRQFNDMYQQFGTNVEELEFVSPIDDS